MKVGLVGFGMVAERFHAPLITAEPGLQLTHVVERHKNRSQQLYPEVSVVRSLEQLLASPVEMVVILTPNTLHFPQARQALKAGKHVVLDKPVTVTSAEADQLIEVAKTHDKMLTVFHNRRWDSDFLTLKKLLEEKALGRLVELESHFDRFRPRLKGGWREESLPGSGVLYDLGSHLIDQAFQLFGSPRRLLAEVRSQREGTEADDFFEVLLDYGELRVTLKSSCLAAEPKLRFLARGTEGAWMKHGLDPQEAALAAGARPTGPDWGREEPGQWGKLYRAEQQDSIPSEAGDYRAFYRKLAEGSVPVSAGQARDVIRAIELCQQSQQEGRWLEF